MGPLATASTFFSPGTTNGLAHKGHLIFLPASPGLPLNFFRHSGHVITGLSAMADSRVHVLHRPGKLGLGTAILTGMRYALAEHFDYFVQMDADFSHHPRYLPALLAGMSDHDVMLGSRYISGGGTLHWPQSRLLM